MFPQMLAFVIVPALLALALAAPGGYTGLGGMYKNMQVGSTLYPFPIIIYCILLLSGLGGMYKNMKVYILPLLLIG